MNGISKQSVVENSCLYIFIKNSNQLNINNLQTKKQKNHEYKKFKI